MSNVLHGLLRVVLSAGLIVGIAVFVGCDGGNDSGGGSDAGSENDGAGNGDGGSSDVGGGSGSVSINHDSPEALFDSVLQAAQARDFRAIASAYPPSAHDEMATGIVAISSMTMMSPSTDKDAIRAVLEKHGINPDDLPAVGTQMHQEAEALAANIEDKPGFFGDMMGTLPEMRADAMRSLGMSEDAAVDATTLSDLQIDGDTASARLNAAGLTDDEERRVNFVREDGKWYMGLDG